MGSITSPKRQRGASSLALRAGNVGGMYETAQEVVAFSDTALEKWVKGAKAKVPAGVISGKSARVGLVAQFLHSFGGLW